METEIPLNEIKARCESRLNGAELYEKFRRAGYELGQGFQCIKEGWCGDGEAITKLKIKKDALDNSIYEIHPGLLDSMLQSMVFGSMAYLDEMIEKDSVLIPFGLSSLRVYEAISGDTLWCYSKTREEKGFVEGDVTVCGEAGNPLLQVEGLIVRLTDKSALLKDISRENWLYAVEWEETAPPPVSRPSPKTKTFILFSDQKGVGKQLEADLIRQELPYIRIFRGEQYEQPEENTFRINPSSNDDFRHLFDEILSDDPKQQSHILFLWGLDSPSSENLTSDALESHHASSFRTLIHTIQAIAEINRNVRIWLITQNAQPVNGNAGSLSVAQSSLWGMGKVISLEHPELWGGLVDLDDRLSDSRFDMLIDEIEGRANHDQIAFRNGGKRYEARLKNIKHPPAETKISVDADSSYLITGAFGSLGLLLAQWLVNEGARHLILLGRSDPDDTVRKTIEELEQNGTNIVVLKADVSKEEELSSAVFGNSPASNIEHQTSNIKHQTSNIKHQTSNIKHQTSRN